MKFKNFFTEPLVPSQNEQQVPETATNDLPTPIPTETTTQTNFLNNYTSFLDNNPFNKSNIFSK